MTLNDYEQYCPFCSRVITASNIAEYESGEHDGYLFVHGAGIDHPNDFPETYEIMQ